MHHSRLNLFANLRDAADREAAITLLVLVAVTVLALAVLPEVVAGSDAATRDAVLKAAGGVLLLLGSYYAARTLKENRTDKRTDQILKAIELLAKHDDSGLTAGAVSTLEELAASSDGKREEWQRRVIERVLECIPYDSETKSRPKKGHDRLIRNVAVPLWMRSGSQASRRETSA
jgi:hypothetical protein